MAAQGTQHGLDDERATGIGIDLDEFRPVFGEVEVVAHEQTAQYGVLTGEQSRIPVANDLAVLRQRSDGFYRPDLPQHGLVIRLPNENTGAGEQVGTLGE